MKPISDASNTLKYKHVEIELRKVLGRSNIGDKLPPERELAELLDCNVLTVRKGIQPLVEEGLLHRKVGSGTFVAKLPLDSIHTEPPPVVSGMDHIGLLMHTAADPYAYRVMQELAREALRRGTELRSMWTRNFEVGAMESVKDMVRAGCQALILPWFPAGYTEQVRAFVLECPIPVVLPQIIHGLEHLCFEKRSVYGASTTLEVEGVCEYFLRLGVGRIHFIGPDNPEAPVLQQRITAYVCYASKRGFEPTFRLFDRLPDGAASLARREKEFAGDLAILSYDDAHAVRFMTEMHKIGLSAPRDYRIIGHNDTSLAQHSDPPLSTIRQNFAYVSSAMIDHAQALAHGESAQSASSPNPQLIVRGSCGGREQAASFSIPKLDIEIDRDAGSAILVAEDPTDYLPDAKDKALVGA